jgi:hypothetical protein
VCVIVEVLLVGSPVVWLQDVQRRATPYFLAKLCEHVGELCLRQVLEQIARKDEVDGCIREKLEVGHTSDSCRHAASHVLGKRRPHVDGGAGPAPDVVDEVGVACAELEDVKVRINETLEVAGAERGPEYFPVGVPREARSAIAVVVHALRHPKTIPRIIRIPTANARRLLALPPLLTPTRS